MNKMEYHQLIDRLNHISNEDDFRQLVADAKAKMKESPLGVMQKHSFLKMLGILARRMGISFDMGTFNKEDRTEAVKTETVTQEPVKVIDEIVIEPSPELAPSSQPFDLQEVLDEVRSEVPVEETTEGKSEVEETKPSHADKEIPAKKKSPKSAAKGK